MASHRVSVIIPAYNDERGIPSAIHEIEEQTYKNLEILVVDDGSSDNSVAVATKYSDGKANIRIIKTPHSGPSHARNVGLAESKGDVVFFSELDCVYENTYVEKAVGELDSDPKASAVCLTGAPLMKRSTLATECIDIENKAQHRLLNEGKTKPFYAWVFRRDALLKVGAFDEKLFQGEDKDLFKRMENAGYSVAWVPGIHWRHVRDQTTWVMAKKWFTRGRSRLLYVLKHRLGKDLGKHLVPLWFFVVGVVLLPFVPLFGALLIAMVVGGIVVYSMRTIVITWSLVSKKRFYLGYPFFVLVRNFSISTGYSFAMLAIIFRKIQGKGIAWDSV